MVQSVLAQFDNPRFSASTSGWWPPLKKTPSSHGVRMESTGVAEMCGLIIYIYIYILRIPGTKSHDAQAHQFGGDDFWFDVDCHKGVTLAGNYPSIHQQYSWQLNLQSTQSICHVKLQWFETASKVALLQGYRRVKSGFQGCMIC